jgi:hypothetical protein
MQLLKKKHKLDKDLQFSLNTTKNIKEDNTMKPKMFIKFTKKS